MQPLGLGNGRAGAGLGNSNPVKNFGSPLLEKFSVGMQLTVAANLLLNLNVSY